MAAQGPVAVDSSVMSAATSQLAATLLRCFGTSVVDLHITEPPFSTTLGPRPHASSLTRSQAEVHPTVTNRLHENVPLDDLHRQILLACDGQNDVPAITKALITSVLTNRVILYAADGRRIQQPEEVASYCETVTPRVLSHLAKCALLLS